MGIYAGWLHEYMQKHLGFFIIIFVNFESGAYFYGRVMFTGEIPLFKCFLYFILKAIKWVGKLFMNIFTL